MTAEQRKTARWLAIWAGIQLALALGLLAIEINGVAAGGQSTISSLLWRLWAKEPWVIFIVTHTIAAPIWFLAGHFFGQSREVYDRIRREVAAEGRRLGTLGGLVLALSLWLPPFHRF